MENKNEARQILTNIKLGSKGDQELYGITWSPISDTMYGLRHHQDVISNAQALELIESKLKQQNGK